MIFLYALFIALKDDLIKKCLIFNFFLINIIVFIKNIADDKKLIHDK